MVNKMQQLKFLQFGVLCGLAVGCTQTSPTTSEVRSTKESSTVVTARRPVADEQPTKSDSAERTNTAVNERDRDPASKTPIDQNENTSDIQITADIRKRVMAKKMSVNAHNVKIITQDGTVTLRGPVKSMEEKLQIEEIANEVAGKTKVDSQLEVSKK